MIVGNPGRLPHVKTFDVKKWRQKWDRRLKMSTHLDTHVALWLYAGETGHISKRAVMSSSTPNRSGREPNRRARNAISTRDRTPPTVAPTLGRCGTGAPYGPRYSRTDLWRLSPSGPMDLDWTRDVFYCLIVAQAALDGAPLVTTDRSHPQTLSESGVVIGSRLPARSGIARRSRRRGTLRRQPPGRRPSTCPSHRRASR